MKVIEMRGGDRRSATAQAAVQHEEQRVEVQSAASRMTRRSLGGLLASFLATGMTERDAVTSMVRGTAEFLTTQGARVTLNDPTHKQSA